MSSEQYRRNYNRLAQAAAQRAELTGREPALLDLVDQLAIRSLTHARSTVAVELTSLRRIFRDALYEDDQLIVPGEVDRHDWVSHASETEFGNLKSILARPAPEIMSRAREILDRELAILKLESLHMGDDEAADLLAGGARQERGSQKDQRHISPRDVDRFELELADHDRVEAWRAALRGDPAIDAGGLLRIFMRTIFLTGMRPVEVWTSRLMVPNTEIPFTDDDRNKIASNPQHAIQEGLVVPVDQVMVSLGETQAGAAASHAARHSGAPCLLVIHSAKQTNVKADIRPVRIQVLHGASQETLATIGMATLLRRAKLSEKRRTNLLRSMNRKLKAAMARHSQYGDMTLNLYAFRHSFATRVRSAHGDAAAAALTGHSARGSLYHYGERMASRRRGGRGDWLPEADPARMAELLQYWSPEAKGEPGMKPVGETG